MMTSSALPKASNTHAAPNYARPPLPGAATATAAKVAPIKTAYPGAQPAADAPELRTADYFSVDYFSFTYLASWLVIFVFLMLCSLGLGVVAGYLSAYLGV